MSDDPTKPVTVDQAGALFPGPLSRKAVLLRITRGIRGVRLRHQFDGRRYWTCQAWVDEFLAELARQRTGTSNPIRPTTAPKRTRTPLIDLRSI